MSAGDVLAVMDRAISKVETANDKVVFRGGNEGFVHETSDDGLRGARAAVAELIEADKEYDAARAALKVTLPDREIDAALNRWEQAKHRRATALARVQGGAK